jgi:cyclophilin family peptidyl-prolyl cis-trans isomerase/HEAT repeat protein
VSAKRSAERLYRALSHRSAPRAPSFRRGYAALALAVLGVASVPHLLGDARQAPRPPASLRERMILAEDRRAHDAKSLSPLFEGLMSTPDNQRLAVRALGRLENPALVPHLVTMLAAPDTDVRAEAANALGQAVVGGQHDAAFQALAGRISTESDPLVRGILGRTLGRLPYRSANEVERSEALLVALAHRAPGSTVPPDTLAGIAHGFYSLARRSGKLKPLGNAARERLTELARYRGGSEALERGAAQVRRLAMAALVEARAVDAYLATAVSDDPDEQVRRHLVVAAGRAAPATWATRILAATAHDPSAHVRVAAIHARLQSDPGADECARAQAVLTDANPHVALAAIDLAGRACSRTNAGIQAELSRLVETAMATERPGASPGQRSPRTWHAATHALVALARLGSAGAAVARAAAHPEWHLRAYAAQAAGIAGQTTLLERLAEDEHDNVREAALRSLHARLGHRVDHILIGALARTDHQLVRTAAILLAGTPRREEVTQALLAAMRRITAEGKQTSRDARLALLDRLEETGSGVSNARDEILPYLQDFDPAIAAKGASILTRWTGTAHTAQPTPVRSRSDRSLAAIATLPRVRAIVTVSPSCASRSRGCAGEKGSSFTVRLLSDEAPTNVARFAELARAGAYNGTPFHRVEPNFVIQGGGENEYDGHGTYTRDELGLRSHTRGTVGISTRGRDTGDGQFFINLIDNPRLDHDYTIVGVVTEGMNVVDGILEGDVIARVIVQGR